MATEVNRPRRQFKFSPVGLHPDGLTPAATNALREINSTRFGSVDTGELGTEKVTSLVQLMSCRAMAGLLLWDILSKDTNTINVPRKLQILHGRERLPDNPLALGLAEDMLVLLGLQDKIKLTVVTKDRRHRSGAVLQNKMAAVDTYEWTEAPRWKNAHEKKSVVGKVRNILDATDRARNELLEHNLRLVDTLVKAHLVEFADRGVGGSDLVQFGRVGLDHAAVKFDWRLGYEFSTYAKWWIRVYIDRGIEKTGSLARAPETQVAVFEKLRLLDIDTREILGIRLTDQEVAEEMGVSLDELSILRAKALLFDRRHLSLDAYFHSEDGDRDPGIILSDSNQNTAQSATDEQEVTRLPASIVNAILGLPTRQRIVVGLHFGLDLGDLEISKGDIATYRKLSDTSRRDALSYGIGKLRKTYSEITTNNLLDTIQKAEDATTVDELIAMYKDQGKK